MKKSIFLILLLIVLFIIPIVLGQIIDTPIEKLSEDAEPQAISIKPQHSLMRTWLLYGGLGLILGALIFIAYRAILKIVNKEYWWLNGTILIILSLLLLGSMEFFGKYVECPLMGGSSPCGIITGTLFTLLSVITFVIGIILLIFGWVKHRKQEISS